MKHIFCILFLMAIGLLLAETWIYEKTVVELPMGEEEGQLSLRLVPEGIEELDAGPTSFTVDEDENIYVLTRRKDIIKKFDKNGNFICASKYERNAGDVIRFLGYHNGMIYTMSYGSDRPWVRKYNRNLEIIDSYLIQKPENTFNGLSFIESNSGKFGLLRNSGPQNIEASELVLSNNVYHYKKMELFDLPYKPVDLQSVWPSDIGYRFMNFDTSNNLYFERYIAPGCATDLGIINNNSEFVFTNVVLDSHIAHGIHFYNRVFPVVTKNGNIYNIVVTEEKIEFIHWYKIGEEK